MLTRKMLLRNDSIARKHEKDQVIIWVSMDISCNPARAHTSTSIHHHLDDEHQIDTRPWFELKTIQHLRSRLGVKYAFSSSEYRALHQGVLVSEILRHHYRYQIIYMRSPNEARDYLASLPYTKKKSILVWLDAFQDIHPHEWMHAYDTLSNECKAIYPPREEIVFADFKIYDMQAFERIAEQTGTYRPKTCYPGRKDSLPADEKSVMKRSHSCCANHVKIIHPRPRGKPPPRQQLSNSSGDAITEGYYRWMQQAYVPSLVDWGELRVFFATKSRKDGGREPYIAHVVRTTWMKKATKPREVEEHMLGDKYSATEIKPGHRWPEYPDLTYSKLTKFALRTYRELQKTGEVGFQSLSVGGRLDIGVSPDGKEFFVNELTRWYGAHQFAMDTQDPPYDKICLALTKSYAETMGVAPRTEPGKTMDVEKCSSGIANEKGEKERRPMTEKRRVSKRKATPQAGLCTRSQKRNKLENL